MNKVFLIGNLTRDPELSTTNSGISVCRISIAVSRRFANADGSRETDFFNIVVWRGLGENCNKYLNKGSKCAVSGELQNRSYDAQDGSKRYITEVIASDVEFLGSPNSGTQPTATTPEQELQPIDDDSLPF